MGFRSKRYKGEFEKVSKEELSLGDAVKKVKTLGSTKFDQSVECVMHLGIDPKQADQMIRGALSLPHGIGKSRNVIAFCENSDVAGPRKRALWRQAVKIWLRRYRAAGWILTLR